MSRESYDELPYPADPFVESHPSTMQTFATILGVTPAPIETARVLELGCATGGNIIPMACAWPNATFVGIDYSPRQIDEARRFADDVGAANLRLESLSITELTPDFGQFDYILAHGVFSWVPPPVQDSLFRVLQQNLSENGVAYVSYNVYPGWHLLEWVRNLMLLHTPASLDVDRRERIRRSREIFETIVESPGLKDKPIAQALKDMMSVYYNAREEILDHDVLEDDNHPVYFKDFIARASAHGLQYLADAVTNGAVVESASSPKIKALLESVASDNLRLEQYLDFIRNNRFRRSLLVHSHRKIDPSRMFEQFLKAWMVPTLRTRASESDIRGNQMIQFHTAAGAVFNSSAPLTKVTLEVLSRTGGAPRRTAELLEQAAQTLKLAPADLAAPLQQTLSELAIAWTLRLVNFCVTPAPAVFEVSERPEVWRVARYQASLGMMSLTNLRHEVVKLQPDQKHVLDLVKQLDGSRTVRQVSPDPGAAKIVQGLAAYGLLVR